MTEPERPAPAAERIVRAALASRASTRALANAPLEPIRGGLSNHAWKAERGGRHWFVRLGGPDSTKLGVNRESECALLSVVSKAGLAPPVIACDAGNGLLVTPFVSGGPWTREDARSSRNVERLARCLRVLHGLPAPSDVRDLDFRAQARRLEAELEAARGTHTSDSGADADELRGTDDRTMTDRAVRAAAESAFEVLASREPARAVCHNDVHHLNVLDDGERLWLVDWEYGGLGDPIFDLASFACQHEFTAGERQALLEAYAGTCVVPVESLEAACIAFDYVQWLWYRLWAASNPAASSEYTTRADALGQRLVAAGR